VLRVDELAKPAGQDCVHQQGELGCGIHASRPPVCRGYHCLWLQGGLEDDERPDRTGGIVDLEAVGAAVQLAIREVRPGAFDESQALQRIASRYREEMPVRITDTLRLDDPNRSFRVLLADGVEHRVAGEQVEIFENGVLAETKTLPFLERLARRLSIVWRKRALRRLNRRE
jgi:Fe-S-cluster containining protein